MSANDQLERLLYVLPRAAQPAGARIADVAHDLGVAPEVILADIEEATARVFYHPAGMVDAFNLSVEGDVVRLYGGEFNRPVRLSAPEAMALGLGLRVLAAEADADRRAQILALAHRLEQELVAPALELQPLSQAHVRSDAGALEMEFGADDFRGAIAEAIEAGVWCDVVYLKPGESSPAPRRMAPVRLLYARGNWYVRAIEPQSGEVRRYRLDRILELQLAAEKHGWTDRDDAPAFATDGGQKVRVRYSSDVARWVAERENAQCEPDGTLVLTHDVVDSNWLVRHVLQYGGAAVVETPEARSWVARAAEKLAGNDYR